MALKDWKKIKGEYRWDNKDSIRILTIEGMQDVGYSVILDNIKNGDTKELIDSVSLRETLIYAKNYMRNH